MLGLKLRYWIALAVLVLGCWGLAIDAHAAPVGFTLCASEDGSCVVPSASWVTIGAGDGTCDTASGLCVGSFSPLYSVESNVICTVPAANAALGYLIQDPAPGQLNQCFYIAKDAAPPNPPASAASSSAVTHDDIEGLKAWVLAAGCAAVFALGFNGGKAP